MRPLIVAVVGSLLASAVAAHAEHRCGWLSNSAMGKWDLYDAQGAWQIMFLGGDGRQAEGMEMIPDLAEGEYVRTFATKGYACACMSVDTEEEHILQIHSVKQLPLSVCQQDPAIQYFLNDR